MPFDVTRLMPSELHSDLSFLDAHWSRVLDGVRRDRRAALDRHALLVVAQHVDDGGRERLCCWLRTSDAAGTPIALTVGAHLECDVNGVAGASLRHAVVLVDPQLRPGSLDVFDLHSGEGLRAHGQRGVRRLQALGALRFGVGSADIVAVALLPGDDVDVAAERARAAGVLMERAYFRVDEERRARVAVEGCGYSVIGPSLQRAGLTRVDIDTGRAPATRDGVLCGDDEVGRVFVRTTHRELANGVLVGRADRCHGARGLSQSVSRVHVLVLARGDGLLFVDVGSTNGTVVVDGSSGEATAPTLTARQLTRGRRAACGSRTARARLGGTTEVVVDVVEGG